MVSMLGDTLTGICATEALGFIAGLVISVSAFPQIMRNHTLWGEAARQSISRNALLVLGNLLWTIYGINKSAPAIMAMCATGALLNAVVLTQIWRARLLVASPEGSPTKRGRNSLTRIQTPKVGLNKSQQS